MKIPSPRIQILDKQKELERTHCEGCEIRSKISREKNSNKADRYCLSECDIGKHLKHLGNLLLETKAKSVKKIKKDVEPLNKKGLTKEIYQILKAQGKSDKKIMDMHVVDNASFYKMKNEWGLVKAVTKRDEINQSVEDKLKVANEKLRNFEDVVAEKDNVIDSHKSEFVKFRDKANHSNTLIFDLKEKLEAVSNERLNREARQPKECDCTSDKVLRLESLLANSENHNDNLITQIKSLSKFKNMYFKTAEVLKIHLPN